MTADEGIEQDRIANWIQAQEQTKSFSDQTTLQFEENKDANIAEFTTLQWQNLNQRFQLYGNGQSTYSGSMGPGTYFSNGNPPTSP